MVCMPVCRSGICLTLSRMARSGAEPASVRWYHLYERTCTPTSPTLISPPAPVPGAAVHFMQHYCLSCLKRRGGGDGGLRDARHAAYRGGSMPPGFCFFSMHHISARAYRAPALRHAACQNAAARIPNAVSHAAHEPGVLHANAARWAVCAAHRSQRATLTAGVYRTARRSVSSTVRHYASS